MYTPALQKVDLLLWCYEGGSEGKFEERWREGFEGGGAANLPPPGEPSRSQAVASKSELAVS